MPEATFYSSAALLKANEMQTQSTKPVNILFIILSF